MDIVKVLGYGVIGLGFLLGFMAYRLLAQEIARPILRDENILKEIEKSTKKYVENLAKTIKETKDKNIRAIWLFMAFSLLVCLTGGMFLLPDRSIPEKTKETAPCPIQTPCPTPSSSPPVAVSIPDSFTGFLNDLELVEGSVKLHVFGDSSGVTGTQARIYVCSQYVEEIWWCKNAAPADNGKWEVNLYPGSNSNPIKNEAKVKLIAVIDPDGSALKTATNPEAEFALKELNRFDHRSQERNPTIILKIP